MKQLYEAQFKRGRGRDKKKRKTKNNNNVLKLALGAGLGVGALSLTGAALLNKKQSTDLKKAEAFLGTTKRKLKNSEDLDLYKQRSKITSSSTSKLKKILGSDRLEEQKEYLINPSLKTKENKAFRRAKRQKIVSDYYGTPYKNSIQERGFSMPYSNDLASFKRGRGRDKKKRQRRKALMIGGGVLAAGLAGAGLTALALKRKKTVGNKVDSFLNATGKQIDKARRKGESRRNVFDIGRQVGRMQGKVELLTNDFPKAGSFVGKQINKKVNNQQLGKALDLADKGYEAKRNIAGMVSRNPNTRKKSRQGIAKTVTEDSRIAGSWLSRQSARAVRGAKQRGAADIKKVRSVFGFSAYGYDVNQPSLLLSDLATFGRGPDKKKRKRRSDAGSAESTTKQAEKSISSKAAQGTKTYERATQIASLQLRGITAATRVSEESRRWAKFLGVTPRLPLSRKPQGAKAALGAVKIYSDTGAKIGRNFTTMGKSASGGFKFAKKASQNPRVKSLLSLII